MFLFGLTYHREQRYGSARGYFEKAISADPGFPTAHYFHGWATYYLGDLEASRKSFLSFLQMNPNESDTYFGLGLIDLDEDELASAEKNFRKAIDIENAAGPKSDARTIAKSHARLAEVYERQDRLHEAKDELVQATQTYPDLYEAYYKLYRVLIRLGDTQAAKDAQRSFFESKERVRPGSTGGAATRPELAGQDPGPMP